MLNFCTQCGSKLQPGFKFCPSCGEKLPEDEAETLQPAATVVNSVVPSSSTKEDRPGLSCDAALLREPLRSSQRQTPSITSSEPAKQGRTAVTTRKRKSCPSEEEEEERPKKIAAVVAKTPDKKTTASVHQVKEKEKVEQTSIAQTPVKTSLSSPRNCKSSPRVKDEMSQAQVFTQSPSKSKGKKRVCPVEMVPVGSVLCDQSSKQWKLVELLWQTESDLTYAVCQANQKMHSNACKHILRLGAKEGQIFNEQNFHLRAAKPDAVEKWLKLRKMDFLGIPSCVGFGLHDAYRFLVFPCMGKPLQNVLDEGNGRLPEKTVLQLAVRLLDSLEFIHEKEYAHADIHAGNIYISADSHTEVFLSGFGHAFRFCPSGKHVEYRQGSRTAHQGHACFISLDSHKGAGPSRRSDLQSLGYCMLFWMTGTLPWSLHTNSSLVATEKERFISDVPGLVSSCFKKKNASGSLLDFLSAVMGLQYHEKPDYSLLRGGLHASLQQIGGSLNKPLDLQVNP